MQILIEAPFDLSDELKAEINEEVKSLGKYHEKITQAHVYFKSGDGTGEDFYSSDIQLHIPGSPLFVSADDADYLSAFAGAIEKMEQALRRAKSIREDKYKQKI